MEKKEEIATTAENHDIQLETAGAKVEKETVEIKDTGKDMAKVKEKKRENVIIVEKKVIYQKIAPNPRKVQGKE